MRGEIPIGMDGVPFVTLGSEVRECQYGPDRSRPKIKVLYDPFISSSEPKGLNTIIFKYVY